MSDSFKKIKSEYEKKTAVLEKDRWETYKDKPLDEVLEAFVEWYIAIGEIDKYNTRRECARKKKNKVNVFFRDTGLKLNEITLEDRKAHKYQMLRMIENEERSNNYVSNILTDLNIFLCRFLKREDLRVSSIDKIKKEIDRLTRKDLDKMIAEIEKRTDIPIKKKKLHKAILLFFWNECPRTSEGIINLRLKDVRFDNMEVRLRGGKRDKVAKKDLALATPTLTIEAKKALEEYLPYRDSDDMSPETPVFVQVGKKGRKPGKRWLRNMMKDYAIRAGIKKEVYPNAFRKSGGTVIANDNILYAANHLGHINISTTKKHYVCQNAKDKKKLNQLLSSNKKATRDEIISDIVERYTKSQISEEDLTFILKSLKDNEDKNEKSGKWDISYM